MSFNESVVQIDNYLTTLHYACLLVLGHLNPNNLTQKLGFLILCSILLMIEI